jgi:serine/threonine protein kinase
LLHKRTKIVYCGERKLNVKARLRIFLQVLKAVGHRIATLSCTLKPGNILVDREGSAKLLDFGTASPLEERNDMPRTRVRMLTPRYASTEQPRGERVNTATDTFSLGVILYEVLTVAWPFGDPSRRGSSVPISRASSTAVPFLRAPRRSCIARASSCAGDGLR